MAGVNGATGFLVRSNLVGAYHCLEEATRHIRELAGARSRHNVYMSVPLVWTMISSHTTTPFASSPVYLLVVILVGWGAVYLLYKKAPKVPGF